MTYLKGFVLGMVICAALVAVGVRYVTPLRAPDEHTGLLFEPQLADLTDRRIFPDRPQEFEVVLQNVSGEEAWFDELKFSCPCATGSLSDSRRLPFRLAAGGRAPVRVKIQAMTGEVGTVSLRTTAFGRIHGERVSAANVTELFFAQGVNASDRYIALGEVAQQSGLQTRTVKLWYPNELGPPGEVSAAADDPCVTASVHVLPPHEQRKVSDERGVEFADLIITVDPSKAPERLAASVLVRGSGSELRIPVLGFVAPSKKRGLTQ